MQVLKDEARSFMPFQVFFFFFFFFFFVFFFFLFLSILCFRVCETLRFLGFKYTSLVLHHPFSFVFIYTKLT